jgi:hypothetical protein
LYKAALAYGLFDPEYYRDRYGEDGQAKAEELWLSYLSDGWRSGRHPSERFHAYRYDGLVEGFAAGADEPVLHALLFGMRKESCRKQVLACLGSPLELSEIASVRRRLRLESLEPGCFRGEMHLLIGGVEDLSFVEQRCSGMVDGKLDVRILERPLDEFPERVVEIMGSIIPSIRFK